MVHCVLTVTDSINQSKVFKMAEVGSIATTTTGYMIFQT